MIANLKNMLLVVGWAFSLNPANAFGLDLSSEECFRPSLTVQKGESLYTYPKARKLSEQENTAVLKLLEALAGQWQGSMDEINCHGSEKSSSKEIDHFLVKAKACLGREGDFYIQSDLYSEITRTASQQVHNLYLNEKILRWGNDKGFVEPINVTIGQLFFLKRTATGGVIREFFVNIAGDRTAMEIDEEIYAWGRLSSRRHWQLTR
jgi:hypothetical protein